MCTYLQRDTCKCIIKHTIKSLQIRFVCIKFVPSPFNWKTYPPRCTLLWSPWIRNVINSWNYFSSSGSLGSLTQTNTFRICLALSSSWIIFSGCVFTWTTKFLFNLLLKVAVPFLKFLSSRPKHLSKSIPTNIIISLVRISNHKFE